MKKKMISLLFCILLLSVLVLPASAKTSYINDYANLLTSDQENDLILHSESVKENYGFDVVILTVPELYGKSSESFSDDFYDNNGYSEDGILFLLDMGGRQWHISTSGNAIDAMSDQDLEYIENRVIPYLSDGKYYEAFSKFYDILPSCLDSEGGSSFSLGISLLVGAAIAGISLLIMRSGMDTKKPQHSAVSYQDKGSYHLRQHQDLFLYSNVSKRARPQNNGGSSTHRSSSGRSHGGRGGKF